MWRGGRHNLESIDECIAYVWSAEYFQEGGGAHTEEQ